MFFSLVLLLFTFCTNFYHFTATLTTLHKRSQRDLSAHHQKTDMKSDMVCSDDQCYLFLIKSQISIKKDSDCISLDCMITFNCKLNMSEAMPPNISWTSRTQPLDIFPCITCILDIRYYHSLETHLSVTVSSTKSKVW